MTVSPTGIVARPREHLIAMGKRYPSAWQAYDQFRADRGKDLPNWPDQVFCPMLMALTHIAEQAGVDRLLPKQDDLIEDIPKLAALAAWRPTQGIYRFDPSLFAAIVDTPVAGNLPCEVLNYLPEWCVYIETPGMQLFEVPLHGCFALLNWDTDYDREELLLLLDGELDQLPISLHLGPWTLEEAITRAIDFAKSRAESLRIKVPEYNPFLRLAVEPLLSLVLYLCSTAAEIGDGRRRPAYPVPKKTKHGPRLFPPDKPETWNVGVRIGAALRRAYADTSSEIETETSGSQSGKRPHIRRAHWHGYWSGPRSSTTRTLQLKWLPPIPINVTDIDELPTTIRPIE